MNIVKNALCKIKNVFGNMYIELATHFRTCICDYCNQSVQRVKFKAVFIRFWLLSNTAQVCNGKIRIISKQEKPKSKLNKFITLLCTRIFLAYLLYNLHGVILLYIK
jgi:hypothetical protein